MAKKFISGVALLLLSFLGLAPASSQVSTEPRMEPVTPMRSSALRLPADWSSVLSGASRDAAALQRQAPTADLGRKIQVELSAVERTVAKARGMAPANQEAMTSLQRDLRAHEARLGNQKKLLDSYMEELRNQRQMTTAQYEQAEQQMNQMSQSLARILKSIADMRKLGAASPSGL